MTKEYSFTWLWITAWIIDDLLIEAELRELRVRVQALESLVGNLTTP